MKVLLVGGIGQGKESYAANRWEIGALPNGETCALACDMAGGIVKLHLLVRRLLESGQDPVEMVMTSLDRQESWLVICDEIGGGIVPISREERQWREVTGRICCEIAARADVVERLCCGLPQRLKG